MSEKTISSDGDMKITIVTTFGDQHYNMYAKNFMDSLKKYLDPSINVLIYTDKKYFENTDTWTNYILEDESPELVEFKKRNSCRVIKSGTKGWIYDAVRFSHKSYCIIDAAKKTQTGRLIWLDADTEIVAPLTKSYLNSKQRPNSFVSYLGRTDRYSETGFMSWNMTIPHAADYFKKWQHYYDTDLIYHLNAQLDCHVFDAVTHEFFRTHNLVPENISPPKIDKDHFDKAFKGIMYHYKGDDKQDVRTNFKRRQYRSKKEKLKNENNSNRT